MPDVEFLGLPEEEDAPRTGPTASIDKRLLVVPLLWTAAAALCVIAPFGTIYSVVIADDVGTQSIDGWGRIASGGAEATFGHGPRFGIAFVVVAAGLVTAAALALAPRTRRTQAPRVIVLVSAGVLTGLLGLLFLDYRNEVDLSDANQNADSTSVSIDLGALFWWGLGALALMVAGLLVRRPPRSVPVPEEPAEPHPEDESLTT